ncbi:MAG: creatininase family protein [bacterium]
MREVRWERMYPDELEAAFADRPLVYFPYGLCEPHGPQCTVGLDALKAHAIAVRAAREHGGIVAPPDYWHVHEIGGYAVWASQKVGEVDRTWTTSLPPWQHFRNVLYHVRTADRMGFHAAVFLTGHYGPNWKDLKTLLEIAQPVTKTLLYGLPDWEANTPGFDGDGKSGGDHAGKVETSLLAALEPECVDLSRLPGDGDVAPGGSLGGGGTATARADFLARPPYFAMGEDARASSRREGERMVADEVRFLGQKSAELLAAYDAGADRPGFPTFASVERFWSAEVEPRLAEFASMQADFGRGTQMPEGSRWKENSEIPTAGEWRAGG